MAGSASRWFSRTLRQDVTVLFKGFVGPVTAGTVGELVLKEISDNDISAGLSLSKIIAGDMTCPVNTPIEVLVSRKATDIVAWLKETSTTDTENEQGRPLTALNALMMASKAYNRLPARRSDRLATDRVYNQLLDKLESMNVGFLPSQVGTIGVKVLSTITNVLWYLDCHHKDFHERGMPIPDLFSDFQDFFNYQASHKAKPKLGCEKLKNYVDQLADLLNLPWFLNSKFEVFRQSLSRLMESMKGYHKFLADQRVRTAASHRSPQPVRSLMDTSVYRLVHAFTGSVLPQYLDVYNALQPMSDFEPLSSIEFEPTDRYERRAWFEKLQLPLILAVYTFHRGNFLGNLTFFWKIPDDDDGSDELQQQTILASNKCLEQLPFYSSRAMRKEFTTRYHLKLGVQSACLREMFRFLTNDESSPETSQQKDVDDRVLTYILDADDPDLIWDLRKLNGRPKDPKFDPFWGELQNYLDEVSAVDERRHGTTLHMPFAISVEDLRHLMLERLPPGTPAPSVSWIHMNFQPTNPYVSTAYRYTGRFDVKLSVQQRLLRAEHEDSKYCAVLYKMQRCMAVKYKESTDMLCLDDKAIVPVGEPDLPVSTGVRIQHASLRPAAMTLAALDHDFHLFGIVPSVALMVEIPDSENDSFYRGQAHVVLKDKVLQP